MGRTVHGDCAPGFEPLRLVAALHPSPGGAPTRRPLGPKIPLGRMATPEDLGGIAVYPMSDASRYHTGDLTTVDGGRMINGS